MGRQRVGWMAVLVSLALVAACTNSGDETLASQPPADDSGSTATEAQVAGSALPSDADTVDSNGDPTGAAEDHPESIVMDDFESGSLADWRSASGGAGAWFVYSDGQRPPDPAQSDPNAPFDVPNPPQGGFAAVTDMNGAGTRILYRDVTLEGRFMLHLTVFYAGGASFHSPDSLRFDGSEPNQQFRVDVVDQLAPIDSVAEGDVLVEVFGTSPGGPMRLDPTDVSVDLSPWAGQTVRLRLAGTDNSGPLRAGVDNIRFEPVGTDVDARIGFPVTEEASRSIDLVLHRMSETEVLAALSQRADKAAATDEFSGALLIARDGDVLLEDAWGLADRAASIENTTDTRFRIGSMNKMFTAVATLQLAEAGEVALDDPIGNYLPDYANEEVAAKVTIRHLLTHSGGTGDIFGPEYERSRLDLREHSDYVELYGARPLRFEPGSRFEYSNYGFVLLGAVIEAVTGQSYYEYVRNDVFTPAGMTSTDSLPESEDVPNRAIGYMRAGDTWQSNSELLPWRGSAAGGGYSTVGDLMRFAQALSSGVLISESTINEATSPHQQDYGYGFVVQQQPLQSFGHSGGFPGMNGDLRIFPELGFVIVCLSNFDPPAASSLVEFFTLRMPDHN